MSSNDIPAPTQVDRKIAISFGAVVLLLMLTATGVASYLFAQLQKKEEDRLSSAIAIVLSESISRVSFSGKYHARLLVEEMAARVPELAYISIETTNRQIIAHSDPTRNETLVDEADLGLARQSLDKGFPVVEERIAAGRIVNEVVLPYRGGIDAQVVGVVRLGVNVESTRREQLVNLLTLLVLIAALTAIAIGAVLLLSQHFGRTMRALATQLQGVLNHAPMAIIITDRTGQIREQSREARSLFKRSSENQSMAQLLADNLAQPDAQRMITIDEEVFQSGVKTEQELELAIMGQSCTWHVSKFPIAHQPDGRVSLLCTFIRDITESKRADREKEKLQDQLLHAQKMESIGRLAGGVAHDFNNMLQVILGNTALAMETLSTGSPAHEELVEIRKSAQRSADLTHQLLAFARKQTVSPKILDLNETVSGIMKMLRRLIGENILLEWKPGPDLWKILIDPSQIDQILANLVVNARDAITTTGQITIETSNINLNDAYVKTHPDASIGEFVMLTVSDTGKGMDRATCNRLFEPFFTTKEMGKGTGLGLAMVFGIIKQNSGSITVASELEKGTTFRIYLPRTQVEINSIPDEMMRKEVFS